VPPRTHEDKVLINGYCGPGPPRRSLGLLRVEAGLPGSPGACAGQGGPDLPSYWGGGPEPPRAPGEVAGKPALPRVRWQPAFYRNLKAQVPLLV
jgi:hypothetical protein